MVSSLPGGQSPRSPLSERRTAPPSAVPGTRSPPPHPARNPIAPPAVIVAVVGGGSSEQSQSPPLSAPVLRLHFRCRVTDAKKWCLVPLKTKEKNSSKEGFHILKKGPTRSHAYHERRPRLFTSGLRCRAQSDPRDSNINPPSSLPSSEESCTPSTPPRPQCTIRRTTAPTTRTPTTLTTIPTASTGSSFCRDGKRQLVS